MKNILVFILLFTLVSSLSSCRPGSKLTGGDVVQVVQSIESDLKLEFPASWRESDIKDIASIQMAHPVKEQYFVVIETNADVFVDDFTLDDFIPNVLGPYLETLDEFEEPVVKNIVLGNGFPSKQYEMRGTFEKLKVKFLITYTKAGDAFYQLFAWAMQTQYNDAKVVFKKILASADFGEKAGAYSPGKEYSPGKKYSPGKDTNNSIVNESSDEQDQVIKSVSSNMALELSMDWVEEFDIPYASIEVANYSYDCFIIVYENPVDDYTDGFTLEKFTSSIKDDMMQNLNADVRPASADSVIAGDIAAKQFEISGAGDDFSMKYLVTCIKTDDVFYTIIAGAAVSNFENARPLFDEVLSKATF